MVVAASDDLAADGDDGADRHFAGITRALRLDERGVHQLLDGHKETDPPLTRGSR